MKPVLYGLDNDTLLCFKIVLGWGLWKGVKNEAKY